MLDMIKAGRIAALERDAMMARFASGEIGMILCGSYSIPEFERIGLPFAVAPYPRVVSTGRPVAPLLDFKGFAMSRSSRSPVSAQRLLEHLSGIGAQQRFAAALSKIPANEKAWEAARGSNRYHRQLSRSAEIGLVIPPGPGYATYKNIMWKMLRFIFSGVMEPDKALAEARRLIDANLRMK
jgi:maltose-binding protein MalE